MPTPETLDVVDAAEIMAAEDEVKAEMNAIQRERNVGIAADHFHTQKHHRSCTGVLRPFGHRRPAIDVRHRQTTMSCIDELRIGVRRLEVSVSLSQRILTRK